MRMSALLPLLTILATLAAPAHGQSPARKADLFARATASLAPNALAYLEPGRMNCLFRGVGELCTQSGATTLDGWWPKGTFNNHVFNSGLQLAGIVDPAAGFPWAGDTSGAFLFDHKGITEHGAEGRPLASPSDSILQWMLGGSARTPAPWPDEAHVALTGPGAALVAPALRGARSVTPHDLWWVSTERDATLLNGRPHQLGVAVEHRVVGVPHAVGAEDMFFVLVTAYNITTTDPAAYAAYPPATAAMLLEFAERFQAENEAHFGIEIPDAGYWIREFAVGVGADFDVADAGENLSTAHLPFSLGSTYSADFRRFPSWAFDATIHSAPFHGGAGFVGVKFLGGTFGRELSLVSGHTGGGGGMPVARDVQQLWRYLTYSTSVLAGDANCSSPAPVCYFNNSNSPSDTRSTQSVGPLDLMPGGAHTVAFAYLFAAPMSVASQVPGVTIANPGNRHDFADPDVLATSGAQVSDSAAGFLGYTDVNGDGVAQEGEYLVHPRSLLGKARVAQRIFEIGFEAPAAPDAPEFYLIPGSNEVTVLWRPSSTEEEGDPYFQHVANATYVDGQVGAPVANPLYDPNYRQFDVQGYRIYRGRVDNPASMTLLADFRYDGTWQDFSGLLDPDEDCAPELGIVAGCSVPYDSTDFRPGVTREVSRPVQTFNPVVQTRPGDRIALPNGLAYTVRADTALPTLQGVHYGVPFTYVDQGVRNSYRYFYSVTAYDLNSLSSGPSSQESARITKAITPRPPASNQTYAVTTETSVWGRGVRLEREIPTLDAATGRFSGPMPPANAWNLSLQNVVEKLLDTSGEVVVRLDSIVLGNAYQASTPHTYHLTVNPGEESVRLSLPLQQNQTSSWAFASVEFPAVPVDVVPAIAYGLGADFAMRAALNLRLEGTFRTGSYGRGCVSAFFGVGFELSNGCDYNGARWFDGPSPVRNETMANPTAGAQAASAGFNTLPTTFADWNNAGELEGVSAVYQNRAYYNSPATYRNVEGILGGAARAADFNVYWGAGGTVDSVVDVTHNVPVPFSADRIGGTWGILNTSAGGAGSIDERPDVLTIGDFGCLPTLRQFLSIIRCSTTTGEDQLLTRTAELGTIAFVAGSSFSTAAPAAPAEVVPGFLLYLPGHVFTVQMAALPADGAVWSLRSYIGAIAGGRGGLPGEQGDYVFTGGARTFSAVGAELRLAYTVSNEKTLPTLADLNRVHTVPDPYYVNSGFEQTVDENALRFVNLPTAATIRIYSSSGVLVDMVEHNSGTADGSASWDVRNRDGELVASGVYFYHLEAGDARRVGRFTVVRSR